MIFVLLACAPDIRDLDGDGDLDVAVDDTAADTDTVDTSSPDYLGETDPHITFSAQDDGSTLVVVDTLTGVTYLDLDTPAQTLSDQGWELSFERYFVRVNGGTDGDGGVEVAIVEDLDFGEVGSAPATGWTTDSDDGFAMGDWYIYDSVDHTMSAAPYVYVLRNAAGTTWKLQFLSYYDDFGNTGHLSFYEALL